MPTVGQIRAIFERDVVRCKHGEGCKVCCWGWAGGTRKGKPLVSIKKQSWTVASVAWRLYYKKRPDTRLLTLCKNVNCTNPLHWETYHNDDVILERFWSKVLQCEHGWTCETCCWPWQAGKNTDGYGNFTHKGHTINAARVAWVLYWNKGVFPNSDVVTRHQCNTPPCCNPNHIAIGTQLDNMKDRTRAGRSVSTLSEQQVREIRVLYASGQFSESQLATRFHVGVTAVSNVLTQKTWAHIQDNLQEGISRELSQTPTRIRSNRTYVMNAENVKQIRVWYNEGRYSQDELATRFGISKHQVGNILRGVQWKDVGGPIAVGISEQLGERNINSVLTADKVRAIRKLGAYKVPQRSIAAQFMVSQRTIAQILTGVTWTHVH